MRVLFFVFFFCASVRGNCEFKSNESNELLKKLQNWGISDKNYIVSSDSATYQIGICKAPNNTKLNEAVTQKEGNESYALGQLNDVSLVGRDNWIILEYRNGARYNNICSNNTRSASIIFCCGQAKDNMTVIQEHTSQNPSCHYLFQMHVPGMCPDTPQVKKGMSGIAIFFIILLCLASAYLIGGFLFMRIKRGARGIDQIPNLEMWRKLGNLAADGCDYCCRCKSGTPRPGYYIDESGPDFRGDDDILAP